MYFIRNYGIIHPITNFLISLHDNYFTIYNRVYKYRLTRAPLGYSAERAPLGGGQILPPCLTPELIGAARRARRRSKALNEKIPMHIKNFL